MKRDIFFALLFALVLVMFSGSVTAEGNGAIDISLIAPANQTWDSDGVRTFQYNVSGNHTGVNYSCVMFDNFGHGFQASENFNDSVNNGTLSYFIVTGIAENYTGWQWNVGCNSTSNTTYSFATNNNTFYVDTVLPVVTVNSPKNKTWDADGFVFWNLSVSEVNNHTCVLITNLDVSVNTTGAANFYNQSAVSYLYRDNVSFNFSYGNTTNKWQDNNTGAYLWNFMCNDLANNNATLTINNTFFVDTTLPTNFTLIRPTNNTFSSNWTFNISWNATNEYNFSSYYVRVDDNATFLSPEFQANITNRTQNWTQVTTNLTADKSYYILVTAYDLAGNEMNMTQYFQYNTRSTCRTFTAGWNVCTLVRASPINASDLCSEVGVNCSFIAKYNDSHQFQTYTSGASANGNMMFGSGAVPNVSAVFFVYVDTNTTFQGQTWNINASYFWFNLTNASTGWNIVPVLNRTGINLQQLDRSINGNGSLVTLYNRSQFMSYYNNTAASGSKYIPFVRNWTINNGTTVNYGEAVWIHLNRSILNFEWNSTGEVN